MDLPTCPACKQSVLDDDATECPFCGASMTGKPGAAPAAAAPTQKKAATKKKATAKKSDDDDDNPFGDAPAVTGKTIQLLAKPTKGRLHRVVCPMCETAGFHSKQVAGRDVRCANKECLVPIFTAPRPEGEEPEEAPRAEAETKSGTPIVVLAAIILVAAAAIGGGAWVWTSGGGNDDQEPFELPPERDGDRTVQNGNGPDTKPNGGTTEVKPVTPAGPTFEELWASSLQQMVTDSQSQQNRRKSLSRQLTAEAYAIQGNSDAVDQQLNQLAIVAPQQQYLGINPLVTLAWKKLAAGDSAAAGRLADRALTLAEKMPDFGADALDLATELATLLVAIDRTSDAEDLLKPRSDNKSLGQVMEALARANATENGNVDVAVKARPVTLWAAPQRVAVTTSLTAHGFPAKALTWAKLSVDPHTIVQCTSAWGEARLRTGEVGALPEIEKELVNFSPSYRAMVLARLAFALHSAGQSQKADEMLTKAQTALGTAGKPASKTFPTLREIYELKPSDVSPIRESALAAAEIAHAQALLGKEGVWQNVSIALAYARAMGQSPIAAQRALSEPQSGVTARLKAEYNFQTDAEAADAYKTYRTGCIRLKTAADDQFRLQQEILVAACDWGFVDEVWDEIRTRVKPEGGGLPHEPWFLTRIPSIIHTHYRGAKDAARVQLVETTVTPERLRQNAFPRMTYQLRSEILSAGENPGAAANLLDKFAHGNEADSRWAFEMRLRLATRLTGDRSAKDALAFVSGISEDSPIPRQAAFEFVASQIAHSGDRKTVPSLLETARLRPEARVALLRGFLGALQPDPVAPAEEKPAEETPAAE